MEDREMQPCQTSGVWEGFLEEEASQLRLEGCIGICWGKGKREEHCRYSLRIQNNIWKGKLYLLCSFFFLRYIFRDTCNVIQTPQMILKK